MPLLCASAGTRDAKRVEFMVLRRALVGLYAIWFGFLGGAVRTLHRHEGRLWRPGCTSSTCREASDLNLHGPGQVSPDHHCAGACPACRHLSLLQSTLASPRAAAVRIEPSGFLGTLLPRGFHSRSFRLPGLPRGPPSFRPTA